MHSFTRLCERPRFAFFVFAMSFASLVPASILRADEPETKSLAYVQTHCLRCHGEDEQNADRRFDFVDDEILDHESAELWQEVLDAVNRGEMPPEYEPQPSTEETTEFVSRVTRKLKSTRDSLSTASQQRFRRLSRHEYRNTIRDLLGVNMDSFDPTRAFPADDRVDGFDNVGEHLVLSNYLMQCYLEAASKGIEKAIQSRQVVTPIHETLRAEDFSERRFLFRPEQNFIVNPTGQYVNVAHSDPDLARLHAKRFRGAPADGYYTIRVKAEGIHREHPYPRGALNVDREEPIKMQMIATDPKLARPGAGQNSSDRIVETVPLADHEPRVFEFRIWLDKGFVPVIRYANGPINLRASLVRLVKKFHPETKTTNWLDVFSTEPSEILDVWISDAYEGPRMRVHQMEIEGPEPSDATKPDLLANPNPQSLKEFLYRAFRRPPLKSEIARYEAFYQSRIEGGESEQAAFTTVCKAILCSPNFLYVETPPEPGQNEDKGYRLASRLSYFLWSSMPDDELLRVAASGKLSEPKTLLAQTRRMLKDPRAEALVENFTNSWLHLHELGSMPPDTRKFPVYYDRQLEPLMRRETQLFFAEVLHDNLSIEHFIDSDFTFVNRYLAAHYGLPNVQGDEFRRVTLPEESLRGGLLGHASVLTATSNGVETSPVTRGIWVLENILGSPPPPPPRDVEPLEPDIRGATTIREQLAKHRNVATCAECHRKIDPIGFALETFDPIGSFRQQYSNDSGKPVRIVDTTGTLPSGESFADIAELKTLLLMQKTQFAKCLTEKMLTYALGREVGFQERPAVEAIVGELAERGNGLRELVELVVTSDVFNEN
ncbi:DUF1592 domain-containing protein [Planctomycetaceae bacterium SH139]